jgi:hypothetical protein
MLWQRGGCADSRRSTAAFFVTIPAILRPFVLSGEVSAINHIIGNKAEFC